ncbi:MAG: eukaryotic-like serine/threonine-protein kinase [Cyanobacteriota bacterium erpe_2018_sw_39hr_WHONDRS-SW48-000098_B_bin.30]|nr:eukaryotic-like serine/threonine-protein kinase [Cyanobacteriota bacterium erpe_2018_sw_39hr_WHONDRS-SW48-000098_B_bin.30]
MLITELSRSALYTIKDKTVVLERQLPLGSNFAAADLVGQTFDGKYQILREIGAGGMGCVYLAQHLLLNKQVALKTFKSANLTEEERLRFQREAQSIAKLSHPNVIQVFDFGYALDGTIPYYTMELLRGVSLREKLERVGCLSESEAILIFDQVASGLIAAHHKGIIHRDLKPDNFFLSSDGTEDGEAQVKIIDFGIAALALPNQDAQRLTSIGLVFGSPLYMSPEQSMGLPVTAQSDIYSFGCALFQALTGEPPYVGASAFATLQMHQEAPLPRLSDVAPERQFAPGWQILLSTMLAKNPSDRYADFEAVQAQLRAIEHRGVVAQMVRPRAASGSYGHTQDSQLDLDDSHEPDEPAKKISKVALLITIGLIVLAVSGELAWLGVEDNIKRDKELADKNKVAKIAAEVTPPNLQKNTVKPGDAGSEPDRPVVRDNQGTVDIFDQPEQLTEELSNRNSENSVRLNGCRIDSETLQRIADTPWVAKLFLRDTAVDNAALVKLKSLKLLEINLDASNFDDTGAAGLAQCKSLMVIRVPVTKVTPVGVAKLATLKALVELLLEGKDIDNDYVAAIAHCKQLKKLTIEHCMKVNSVGISTIANSLIENLDLNHCFGIDDKALPYMAQMKRLEVLNLDRTRVTAGGIKELCRNSQSVKHISLVKCDGINPAQVLELQREFPRCNFNNREKEPSHKGEI